MLDVPIYFRFIKNQYLSAKACFWGAELISRYEGKISFETGLKSIDILIHTYDIPLTYFYYVRGICIGSLAGWTGFGLYSH